MIRGLRPVLLERIRHDATRMAEGMSDLPVKLRMLGREFIPDRAIITLYEFIRGEERIEINPGRDQENQPAHLFVYRSQLCSPYSATYTWIQIYSTACRR